MFRKFVLMSAIFATELAFVGFVFPFAPIKVGEMETKLICVMLANWFLICFWLSVGSTKAPYRQLICTAILGIVGVIAAVMDTQLTTSLARALNFIATSWYLYAAFYIPRRVAGMKLTFLDRERLEKRKRQFGIGTLLGFMAVLSVPLALNRLANAVQPQTVQPLLFSEAFMLLLMLGIIAVTALPLGIAAFANRGATLKISLALLWCVIATLIVVQFVPRDYNDGGPVFALTWAQIALVFFTARLLGVRWEAGQGASEFASSGWGIRTAAQLQAALTQGLAIASALIGAWLLVFAPIVLQFVSFYIFVAATPAFIIAAHFWRRATPNRFWKAFLISGALPWLYAIFISTQEAWALLFGIPSFSSTSPVEVTPFSGINWADILVILLSPLVIGMLGGAVGMLLQRGFFRFRRTSRVTDLAPKMEPTGR